MSDTTVIDYGKSKLKAAAFLGGSLTLDDGSVTAAKLDSDAVVNANVSSTAAIAASKLQVAAGDDGLTAQSVQAAIQALWTEVFGE